MNKLFELERKYARPLMVFNYAMFLFGLFLAGLWFSLPPVSLLFIIAAFSHFVAALTFAAVRR